MAAWEKRVTTEAGARQTASDAVTGLGWRYVLGEFRTEVLTGSLPLAADVAARAAAVADVEGHLRMDMREDRVVLSLQTAEVAWVTPQDVELAQPDLGRGQRIPADPAGGAGRARTRFR